MFPTISPLFLPVSINEASIDVVRSFQASDWLQADACGLVGHDVDQPILELVAGKVGADETRCVGFGVGQALDRKDGGTGGRNAHRERGKKKYRRKKCHASAE